MADLTSVFGGYEFDSSAVEPQQDYQVLPPGKYQVLIEEAEQKDTKAGTGKYIKLKLQVTEGPSKGRVLFDQINIVNPSQQCVEIGLRCLSALCRAVGIVRLRDEVELVNKVAIACVKVKTDQNEIRTYEPVGGVQQTVNVPAVPPTNIAHALVGNPGACATAPTTKPPWMR